MTALTRRFLIGTGGLLVLGWVALRISAPAEAESGLAQGRLAPFDSTIGSAWEPVARISAELSGLTDPLAGDIRAIDARGDSVVFVARNAWTLVVDGAAVRTSGSALTGSPEYIANGTAIVMQDSVVHVLDATLHRLSTWTLDGRRLRDTELGWTAGYGTQHERMVEAGGALFLPAFHASDSGGRWNLVRVRDVAAGSARIDTVLHAFGAGVDGAAYDVPLPIALPDARVALVTTDRWTVELLDGPDALTRLGTRRDPPRVALLSRDRVKLDAVFERLPEIQRQALRLGSTLPPVRRATALGDEHLLVLTTADVKEATIAEVVRLDGTPIARPWAQPETLKTFSVRGALYRVRELDDAVVIERQRITLPPDA